MLGREFTAAVVLFHDAVGRALGLSAADRKCLDVLDRLGPVSAGQIAKETGLTTGAVTGMIDRLAAWRATYPIVSPLGEDMAALATKFSADELDAIGRYLAETTDILQEHTASVGALPTTRRSRADPAS